jgi:tetratricopeptide (TPR) repeat protein
LDPRSADAQFELGRSLFAAQQYEPAHAAFRRARDEDVCPLRQLTVMREVKLDVAAREGVPVVDYVQIIEDSMLQRYGHRIAGEEFFLDHAHPTIEGNRILAVALVEELIRDGVVHPVAGWRERALPRVTERVESRVDRKMQAVAMRNLARLFSWAGKSEEAERMAKQSLELDPNELESLVVLGSKAAAEGDADRALEYYERVLSIDPNHMEARNNLAVELARRGEHALALQHYEAMLSVDPNQPSVHFNAGLACMRMGDWNAAIVHFERALELRPEDTSVLPSLATALARAGRSEEAVSRYESALEAAPENAEIHMHFATLLGQLQRQAEAMDHLREAARLAPENAAVRSALGMQLVKQEAFEEAKVHLAAAIRLDPELPGTHNSMGTVLWREGKLDEAMAEYEAELRIDPDHVEARNNQAFILVSQGRAREAIAVYRELLRRSPDDAMTLNGLAWILATHPDPDVRNGREAVDLAGRAVELTGQRHPLALLTLAAAYAEVGRFEDATATARQSIAAARGLGQPSLERHLEAVLATFEKGRPYRDPATAR